MRFCSPIRLGSFLFAVITLLMSSAASAQNPPNTLIFYADKQVSESMWAPLFNAIREDLAREDHGLDRNPRLLRGNEIVPGKEFSGVIEVKLLGRCDVVQQAYRPLKPGPLGWVLRVHGEIQPFVYIDCTRMTQVLNPTTLGLSGEDRTRAMSQAIAHVLVHEWIHIATQNAGHTEHGITQAQLAPRQLVTAPSETGALIAPDNGPAEN
ncbi:MAG TPA: hypothetical protein VHT24_10175 [Pseudacidobacterium sp.]|nr:hypothetical protein [Pseudacidobacterium sp.]